MVFEERAQVRSRFLAHHACKHTFRYLLDTILITIVVWVFFFVVRLFVHGFSRQELIRSISTGTCRSTTEQYPLCDMYFGVTVLVCVAAVVPA